MRFLHGRVVKNGNHNPGENGYKMGIRDFRKGSVDPSSPRREASLLTWPGNLTVFGPFFLVLGGLTRRCKKNDRGTPAGNGII
jgi:hypothetical protein